MIHELITTHTAERARTLLQALILLILSVISPLERAFAVLVVLAVADVFGGVAGNVWTGRQEFKFRRAFNAVYKITSYCILILLVHLVVASFGEEEMAETIVKFLTWTISYWYLSNIVGNMCKAFPTSKGFLFLYFALSLKLLPLLLGRLGLSPTDSRELAEMIHRVRGSEDDDKQQEEQHDPTDDTTDKQDETTI